MAVAVPTAARRAVITPYTLFVLRYAVAFGERLAEEPLSALWCSLRRWACRTWPLGLAWNRDVEDEEEKKKMNYSDETINRGPPCVYAYKINDHIRTCSGWWKHQNNPACTKSVSLQNIGLYTEEEKDEVNKVF